MLSDEERRAAQVLFDYLTVRQTPSKADVIIGLGTYHLGAATKAAEFWHAGLAPQIIFSGYKNDRHEKTEAEMLRDEAMELGVPPDAILIENQASNTGLNITLSHALAKQHDLLKTNRVIFVHKPYMTRRTLATAEAQWPDPATDIIVIPTDATLDDFFASDGAGQTIRSMLADYYCIKAYPKKGWQTPQPASKDAEEASQFLIAHGHALKIPV